FDKKVITWDTSTIPMRTLADQPPQQFSLQLFHDAFAFDHDDEDMHDVFPAENVSTSPTTQGYKSKHIKPSNYDALDVATIVKNCKHLNTNQQQDLHTLLKKFPTLFSNQLGRYPHEQIHLDIDPTIPPQRRRAYTVPFHHKRIFKQELDRLVSIGILEPAGRSHWIAGTFIIPKKDGRVRWISDFRGLNKALKRRVYPLPKIGDIISQRTKYKFFSKLDVSMQYYTFELDDARK
ncbi:MAG: hypothetical protein AAF438_21620, partial [Pseudomonadota bacterium]